MRGRFWWISWVLLGGCEPLPSVGGVTGADTGGLGLLETVGGGEDGPGFLSEETPEARASWTVLVFMNGDNELEAAALGDLNELEMVGSDDRVNVLVQLDRSVGFEVADGNWSGARRFRVQADQDPNAVGSPVLAELGEVDSGDPTSVVDFVTWAAQAWPAERYALVLWDHGWSWSLAPDEEPALTKGISSDYGSGNEISIAEGELAAALGEVERELGQPIDLFGFDACRMASWEVAYAVAPYAGVLVSSQDYELADGWPYDVVMADLVGSPEMDAATLGDRIARRFSETGDSTQSVIDLGLLPMLDRTLEDVAGALVNTGEAGSTLPAAAAKALEFEGGWGSDHDLGHLLGLLEEESSSEAVAASARAARAALEEVVVANYTAGEAVAEATGLSIYAPSRGGVDELYLRGIWSLETGWDDLLVASRDER